MTTLNLDQCQPKSSLALKKIQNDVGAIDTSVAFNAVILLDSSRGIYQRTVFSILDLTGTLGGIFGLILTKII